MKITRLNTYIVPPRWLFLEVETDEGITGWGEPILEGHAHTLKAAVEELAPMLIGRNPFHIEDIWQSIYRNGCYRGGPVLMSAMSGVDMALWDIKGKYHNVPIYDLMGGPVREKVRTYCWVAGDRPGNLIEGAKVLMDKGYNACKFNICGELKFVDSYAKVDEIVRNMYELREAVGVNMDLAMDYHGRVHLPMAKILLKELEPLHPLFVEDALVPTQLQSMADLARSVSTPLVTGERLHSRYDFKPVFELRAASIINPDTAHVGGISEMIRIAAMAEAYDVALAPHCPLGPIALAACLQVDAICYNAFIQEQSLGIHYNEGADILDYVTEKSAFEVENGYIKIPTGPGLGIEVDKNNVIEFAKKGHHWQAPVWRNEDGSIAEW